MKHRIVKAPRTQRDRDARREREATRVEQAVERTALALAQVHVEGLTGFVADVVCPVVEDINVMLDILGDEVRSDSPTWCMSVETIPSNVDACPVVEDDPRGAS